MTRMADVALAPQLVTLAPLPVFRPTVGVLGWRISAYHLCGVVGWIAGISLALVLTAGQSLPLWMTGLLAVESIATFLALVLAVKVVSGEENIVYYDHEIAVVSVSALTVWCLGAPVLPYLDAVMLGLGLFLACGRVGCFLVGCCHGQPHRWGVCYGLEHADAGFARHLVGVRLFPIQLVEAVIVLATVVVGTILVLRGAPAGTALAVYSFAYGTVRVALEFVRGDSIRPYWHGVSEAQWTSLAIMLALLGLGGVGSAPGGRWLSVATLGVGFTLVAWAITDGARRACFRPRHVREIADLLERMAATARLAGGVHIGRTSLGLRISASVVGDGGRWLELFGISDEAIPLDDAAAGRLARLMSRLRRANAEGTLARGRHSVYHLILPVAGR
jgi:hypothetical protein